MKIEGKEYQLAINNGPNHLHGGIKGFDKVVWEYTVRNNQLVLSYLSPDLEEGYPGALLVNVTFELNERDEFIINYKAATTKPTVVNLTNHSYFNLAGDHTSFEEIYKHQVYIDAKEITEVNDDLIPTGKLYVYLNNNYIPNERVLENWCTNGKGKDSPIFHLIH